MSEKILIVDDEQEIADLVALYLENENFQVFKFYFESLIERLTIGLIDSLIVNKSIVK